MSDVEGFVPLDRQVPMRQSRRVFNRAIVAALVAAAAKPRAWADSPPAQGPSVATLALGSRADAVTFDEGARSVGMRGSQLLRLRVPGNPLAAPSTAVLKSFFQLTPDWLYLGGHFGTDNPPGHAEGVPTLWGTDLQKPEVKIHFEPDRARVVVAGKEPEDLRRDSGFLLHKRLRLLVWGGCSTHGNEAYVRTLRALFGPVTMCGWHGTTNSKLMNAMLGGAGNNPPHSRRSFFDRIRETDRSFPALRDAWFGFAPDANWARAPYDQRWNRLSVIDPDGQEWRYSRPKRLPYKTERRFP